MIGSGLADRINNIPYAQFVGILKDINFGLIEINETEVEYEYLMSEKK